MDILAISGRIKSLEKRFLTSGEMAGIIRSRTFNELAAMLASSRYRIPQNVTKSGELFSVFEDSAAELVEEMRKNLPVSLFRYFLLGYDYHNLKIICGIPSNGNEEGNYSAHSYVDHETMKRAFREKNNTGIPDYLKPAITIMSGKKDDGMLSLQLKKEYYSAASGLLEKTRSRFVKNYLRIEIDFANIATFIQEDIAGLEKGDVEMFMDGGRIRKERFSAGEVLWKAVDTAYRGLVATPVTAEDYDIARYGALMAHIRKGRVVPFGIETIFAYFAGRQIELDNVRRIVTGRFYDVSQDVLSLWAIPPYQYV